MDRPPRGDALQCSRRFGVVAIFFHSGLGIAPTFAVPHSRVAPVSNRPLSAISDALMHDQLKPDCLTRRNNDVLRLTADTLYVILASGHVEDGVSEIIR